MNEFAGLVDSHFHSASMEAKGLDARQAIQDFFAAGGAGLLDVAVDTEGWAPRRALSQAFPCLWLSAGIHPSQAALVTPAVWPVLAAQLEDQKVVALGEIGLDWYRGREHRTEQLDVFRRQLILAMERDLPVIIHNREADDDLLATLDAVGWKGRGVFHCFSSDTKMAEEGLKRGFWISFAGNVTYPSARGLREVATWLPADRLLVETDSPYLSPQGWRGAPNRPLNAGLTARCIADVRNIPLIDFLAQTRGNFEALMRVKTH